MDKKKKSHGQHGKLNDLQKAEMIKMLGAYVEPRQIIQYFKTWQKVSITPQAVSHYKQTYYKEIRSTREEILKGLEVLPVTEKIYRIKLRQDMIDDIIKSGKDGKTNLWVKKYGGKQGLHLVVNRLLDSIKEELESRNHEFLSSDDKFKEYVKETERQAREIVKDINAKPV